MLFLCQISHTIINFCQKNVYCSPSFLQVLYVKRADVWILLKAAKHLGWSYFFNKISSVPSHGSSELDLDLKENAILSDISKDEKTNKQTKKKLRSNCCILPYNIIDRGAE